MDNLNMKNRNNKSLGLLNFEGDVLKAYHLPKDDTFLIIDDHGEFIINLTKKELMNFFKGEIELTTSYGRTFNYLNEHQNAKPKQEQIDEFLGVESKVDLELWESVQYRMDEEGFDYCFESYSDWDEIKNDEFHRLRKKFLRDMKELRSYVNNKVNEG
jgi:hypothetical protein